jgi:hypothetical protein
MPDEPEYEPETLVAFESDIAEDAPVQDAHDDEAWVESSDDETYWGAPPPRRSRDPETRGVRRPAGGPAHRSSSRPAPATSPASPTYRLNRRGKIVFTAIPVAIVVLIGLAAGGGSRSCWRASRKAR